VFCRIFVRRGWKYKSRRCLLISLSRLASDFAVRLFRATPFASEELDRLAAQMQVLQRLPKDPNQRYYCTVHAFKAQTFGNIIFFQTDFKNKVPNKQFLAAAAHEFMHVQLRTSWRIIVRFFLGTLLSVIAWWVLLTKSPLLMLLGFNSLVSYPLTLDAGASGIFAIWLFIALSQSRSFELACDKGAIKFVNPDDLIGALIFGDKCEGRYRANYITKRFRSHPPTSLRIRNVRSAISEPP